MEVTFADAVYLEEQYRRHTRSFIQISGPGPAPAPTQILSTKASNICQVIFQLIRKRDMIRLIELKDHVKGMHALVDKYGKTPLHCACRFSALDIASWLVQDSTTSPCVWTQTCRHSRTPLHDAAAGGSIDICQLLLATSSKSKCDGGTKLHPEKVDNFGLNTFHFAVIHGHLVLIEWLFHTYNVNLHARSFKGQTAIHFACHHGHVAILEWLWAKMTTTSTLSRIDDHVDSKGWTPLHYAASGNQLNTCQYLIHVQNHALDPREGSGLRPLDLVKVKLKAKGKADTSVVQYLVQMSRPPEQPQAPQWSHSWTESSLVLQWKSPKSVWPIQRYEIQQQIQKRNKISSNHGSWTTVSNLVDGAATGHLVMNLDQQEFYRFRIRGGSQNGWSVFSLPSEPIRCVSESMRRSLGHLTLHLLEARFQNNPAKAKAGCYGILDLPSVFRVQTPVAQVTSHAAVFQHELQIPIPDAIIEDRVTSVELEFTLWTLEQECIDRVKVNLLEFVKGLPAQQKWISLTHKKTKNNEKEEMELKHHSSSSSNVHIFLSSFFLPSELLSIQHPSGPNCSSAKEWFALSKTTSLTDRDDRYDEYGFKIPPDHDLKERQYDLTIALSKDQWWTRHWSGNNALVVSSFDEVLQNHYPPKSDYLDILEQIEIQCPDERRWIGLPSRFSRQQLYPHISGTIVHAQRFPTGHYAQLLAQVATFQTRQLETDKQPLSLSDLRFQVTQNQIQIDLARTFSEHQTFVNTPEGQTRLRNVLLAFAIHNPKIGYCQSMNYIAGRFLCLFQHDEAQAFWTLAVLVERTFPDYHVSTMPGVQVDAQILGELVSNRLPELAKHFKQLHVPISISISQWLLTLFCQTFPSETTFRLFDLVFLDKSDPHVLIYALVLGFLRMQMQELLRVSDVLGVTQLLRHHEKTLVSSQVWLDYVRIEIEALDKDTLKSQRLHMIQLCEKRLQIQGRASMIQHWTSQQNSSRSSIRALLRRLIVFVSESESGGGVITENEVLDHPLGIVPLSWKQSANLVQFVDTFLEEPTRQFSIPVFALSVILYSTCFDTTVEQLEACSQWFFCGPVHQQVKQHQVNMFHNLRQVIQLAPVSPEHMPLFDNPAQCTKFLIQCFNPKNKGK